MTLPIIVEIRIPQEQLDALELLAGGQDNFFRALNLGAAQEIARKMQDHLREYDEKNPNKNSWPRAHYVKGLSDDIQIDEAGVSAEGAQITASPELFHKLNGGDISPKRGKYLAIPAGPQAYAAGSPGEGRTPPLTLLLSNRDGIKHVIGLALILGAPKIAFAHQGLDAKIWYWLTEGPIHHTGDPDILPTDDELVKAGHEGIDEILNMAMEGKTA